MEIESALADRDNFFRRGEVAQLRDSFGRAIPGVVGMHADGGEHIWVTLGDCDGQSIVFDRSDRADRDDLRHAGAGRARDHGFDVAAELCVGEMAMRIDNRCH